MLTVLLCCAALLIAAVYLGITSGSYDMSLLDVVKTLLRIESNAEYDLVIFEFRLPRIVLAILIGWSLGIAGAVIQSITRNGLADPGVVGINAGAGMAVVLFMFLFQGQWNLTGTAAVMVKPLFGLAGGLLATVLMLILAKRQDHLDPQRLLLVGIALSSGFGAVTLFLSLKMNPQDFESAAVWLAGSVHSANWIYVSAVLPWVLAMPLIIWMRSRTLDVMQLNEISVKGLGLPIGKERILLLICSVGLIAASVSVAGSIGFVGLIAPHMARRLVGHAHQRMIPVSGAIGMVMLAAGDYIGKTVFAPAELAVGIVISIIGVPYFVFLLLRTRKS